MLDTVSVWSGSTYSWGMKHGCFLHRQLVCPYGIIPLVVCLFLASPLQRFVCVLHKYRQFWIGQEPSIICKGAAANWEPRLRDGCMGSELDQPIHSSLHAQCCFLAPFLRHWLSTAVFGWPSILTYVWDFPWPLKYLETYIPICYWKKGGTSRIYK